MEFTTLLFFLILLSSLLLLRRHNHNHRHQSNLPLPPGPLGLPLLGSLPFIGPLPHSYLSLLSLRYGPITFLKLGTRNTVVLSSIAAVRSFLKTLDTQFSNRPLGLTARDVAYDGEDMIFADHGAKWALLRKISNLHLLGPKAVAGWTEVRREEVGRAIQTMVGSAQSRRPVVILDLLINTMGNVIGRVTMSQRVFDREEEGEEEEGSTEFKDMVLQLLRGLPPNIGDFLPALAWMDLQGLKVKGKRSHEKFDRMITAMLAKHEATVAGRVGRPDFIDFIKAGGELTQVNIKGLIFDLFVAGTDAASIVTEWAISEMLKNPIVLRRAQFETDAVIGRHRLLQESDIPNLPYLQAICKEALRLHPSAPLGIAHYSSDPAEMDGYRIPGETQVMINIWAIGRDPKAWTDPLEFRPERFLGEGDLEGMMMPFGAGRRICAGKHVGMVMVQYMLGSIIHGFEWEVGEGVELDMEEGMGVSLSRARPLSLLLKLRLDESAYM